MELLAPAATPMRVLDRYVLHLRLGTGGFGTVWQARDERLEREVAVKVVPRDRAGEGRVGPRWREALATARLSHPAIVQLYEAGADDHAAYLVSELVRGPTLAVLLAEGALSDRDVALIGLALADALVHAHGQGVIHRDIKPANVIVPESSRAGQAAAKLTDFGVAHVVGGEGATRTGDVVGTLAYMAPEQAEGDRVTPAVDLYALALVLYEGLTGTNPIRAGSPAATARRVGTPLAPVARRRHDLSPPLGAAIDRAVHVRPERRGTVLELRDALEAALPALEDAPAERTVRDLRGARHAVAEPTAPWDLDPARPAHRHRRPPPPVPLPERVLAGLGAGGLCALGAISVSAPPADPLVLALVAAVLVALLPRFGWALVSIAALTWLASAGHRPGAALVLAPALLLPLVLLARAPGWNAIGALAPLMGIAGLAVAFPLLAGQARSAWTRAALGAVGLVELVLAEPLVGRRLLAGPPGAAPAPHAWTGSASAAVHHVLAPIVSGPLLLAAAPWALAALVLPWLVRGRSAALDAAGAALWATALAAGTIAAAPAAGGDVALGAVLAGIGAVVIRGILGPARPKPESALSPGSGA